MSRSHSALWWRAFPSRCWSFKVFYALYESFCSLARAKGTTRFTTTTTTALSTCSHSHRLFPLFLTLAETCPLCCIFVFGLFRLMLPSWGVLSLMLFMFSGVYSSNGCFLWLLLFSFVFLMKHCEPKLKQLYSLNKLAWCEHMWTLPETIPVCLQVFPPITDDLFSTFLLTIFECMLCNFRFLNIFFPTVPGSHWFPFISVQTQLADSWHLLELCNPSQDTASLLYFLSMFRESAHWFS